MKQVIYYTSEQEDMVQTKDPDRRLAEDYVYIHPGKLYRAGSLILYRLFQIWAFFFIRFGLHITLCGKEKLTPFQDQGYFLYINHTQPVGDPFLPSQILGRKRGYVVCAPTNFSVPVLGRLLPLLGALPIPDNRKQMRQFRQAIAQRIEEKQAVVIYPEAHVWPWYTGIRDFPDTSFQFPLETGAPVFCATLSYHHSRRKKPDIVCTIDGPFVPDPSLSRRQTRRALRDQVYETMKQRAAASDCSYIEYRKKEDA